jgi:hypothetical protein
MSRSGLLDQIFELEIRWMAAWRERDQATLEAMLAAEFALIVSAQPEVRIDRAAWLAQALGPYVCRSLDFRGAQVRSIGEFAVFSAIARQDASVGGVDRSGEFFVTDVWQHRSNGWQVVARYSSLPEPPGSSSRAVRLTAS